MREGCPRRRVPLSGPYGPEDGRPGGWQERCSKAAEEVGPSLKEELSWVLLCGRPVDRTWQLKCVDAADGG